VDVLTDFSIGGSRAIAQQLNYSTSIHCDETTFNSLRMAHLAMRFGYLVFGIFFGLSTSHTDIGRNGVKKALMHR
jgi:hypothetical protein